VTAIGVALVVAMLFAVVMPRFAGDGSVNWAVTVLAGLAAGLITFGIAYLKRGEGEREVVAE
jgi:hypothetical protein